jgi:hypothetical protein
MTKFCRRLIIERKYPTAILSNSLTAKSKRETHYGQNEFRLFAPRESLRPMRQADRHPGMDRRWSAPHCWACDYQFEAVAFVEDPESDSEARAA